MPSQVVGQTHRLFLVRSQAQDAHFHQRLESLGQRLPGNVQKFLPFIKAPQPEESPQQDGDSPLVTQYPESMAQRTGRQCVTCQRDVDGVDDAARPLLLFGRCVDLNPLAVLNLVNGGQFRADMVVDKRLPAVGGEILMGRGLKRF